MDSFDRFNETELPSLASCMVVHVRTRRIHTQLECGLPLRVGQWQITTAPTYSVSILYSITQLLSECHVLIFNLLQMSQSLPTHGFRFLQQAEIDVLKLQELSDDA